MILALIAAGGAVGSVARYLLGGFVQRTAHLGFPVGTLVVNVLGSLAIGMIYAALPHDRREGIVSATLMVGFCGGFTTFSTFSLETVGLIVGGEWVKATSYIALSVASCVAATALGLRLLR
jgi:CrcB protein